MNSSKSTRYLQMAIVCMSITLYLNLCTLFLQVRYHSVVNQAPLGSSHLVAGRLLPDYRITPGVTNPDITQANYKQTLCNPKWHTGSIRPSTSYTSALKLKQIAQYGYDDTDPTHYEEDHLISLQLGGNPTDPKNLWPESRGTMPSSSDKDNVENYLHSELCKGHMTLQAVQDAIKGNWTITYATMLSKAVLGSISATTTIYVYEDEDGDQ